MLGDWNDPLVLNTTAAVQNQIHSKPLKKLYFNSKNLGKWNSVLLVFVLELKRIAKEQHIDLQIDRLPQGVSRLIQLADASPESDASSRKPKVQTFVEKFSSHLVDVKKSSHALLDFFGRIVMMLIHCAKGCARFRLVDLFTHIHESGARALPIISLISFLMGLILAYVGSIQLNRFGASNLVADLVAITVVREIGPIMTAIVMAGRTGAAFAAQLGTMKVNQEIDAYKTMAISPYQFLVLPRLLALSLMMPLLCIFTNAVGILGGGVVAKFSLGISWTQYMTQAQGAIDATDITLSLMKAFAFGLIVAIFGCYRGMNSGENALAVGEAATSAVVSSLVWIIVVDAIFAVIMGVLGI